MNEWISVKDKLPEGEDLVLITYWDEFEDKSARFKVVETALYLEEFGEWRSYAIEGVSNVYTEVIAWMPLPEPCEWDTEDKKIIVKKGKWLDTDADNYFSFRCSECGRIYEIKENFCPNCGADMRSEQKEDT